MGRAKLGRMILVMDYLFVLVLYSLTSLLIFSNSQVAAQEGPGTVIVHPAGQDVELLCSVAMPGRVQTRITWIIGFNDYGVNSLISGVLPGYSADLNSSNLIVKNITMNDNRNNTEYTCVMTISGEIVNDGDTTFLYIAGVPAMVPGVTVDNNTIDVNGNTVTLTLSWGEPFNNLDPIVSYTVSCSGDVRCPPNFTTTDNTTRSYTITNLTTMTNYTFSVVATNSIGSGEAGVVKITTAMSSIGTSSTSRSSSITTTSVIIFSNVIPSAIATTATRPSVIITTTATPSETTTHTAATPSTSTASATSSASTTSPTVSASRASSTDITNKWIIIILIIFFLILSCCGCMCFMFSCCCMQRESHYLHEKLCVNPRSSFVILVILGVITFGISLLIWYMYLKCQNNEKDNYCKIVNASIFVLGIYTCGISVLLWWMYKGLTECDISNEDSSVAVAYQRRQANEVPSVFNQLAEYDDTVHVATSLTKSIQMSADKVPDSAITDETNKRLKISASYAVVSTEDVIARERVAASAPQASIQHQITASGEKYALSDKLAAKNKPIFAHQKDSTGAQQAIQRQNTDSEGKYALPEAVVKDQSIKYAMVEELPTSGRINKNEDVFTPYAEIC